MTEDSFAEQVAALGVALGPTQVQQFRTYRDLILEAADRFNLTAVRDPVEIERRHFLESLALGVELVRRRAMPPDGSVRAIDIGTGAGIPGIPLKIAWPALGIALLEANEKRCRFLRRAIDALGLDGVRVLQGRAEDFGHDAGEREKYGLALARAVAPLAILLEYSLPLLAIGGFLAAPKGSAAPRELVEADSALRELGGRLDSASDFQPPGGRPQTLILVRKVAATPERYPRRAGVAARRPIA